MDELRTRKFETLSKGEQKLMIQEYTRERKKVMSFFRKNARDEGIRDSELLDLTVERKMKELGDSELRESFPNLTGDEIE